MCAAAVEVSPSRGLIANRCLLAQAFASAVATAIGVYLAVGTATDIRQTGMASLQGVTVSGCIVFAVCAAVSTVVLVASAVGLRRSVPVARWLGLSMQAVIAAALLATARPGLTDSPVVAAVWLAMLALIGGAVYGMTCQRTAR
jgi:hypothetical protein